MNTKSPATSVGSAAVSQAEPAEGIILLDLALKSVAIDSGGRAILAEAGEVPVASHLLPVLPADITDTLRAAAPSELSSTIIRMTSGDCHYTCRVFLMHPQNGMMAEPLLALHLKRERSVSEAVRRVGRAYHLTAREQEVLLGIATGLTSRQVAQQMDISRHTVNAFLRLIMVKMGVSTRAGIVGKLLNGKNGRTDPATGSSGEVS